MRGYSILVVLCIVLATASASQHLRTHDMQHDLSLPFLGDINPLQIAQLMSGDYASILPASIQPLARKILGQEQQSGPAGFLNQASRFFGSGNQGGGLLGGLGNLFGGSSGQQSSGAMGNILNAFGGNTGAGSGFLRQLGLPF